jgi:DNA-binding NarL/FixJ family response regulator
MLTVVLEDAPVLRRRIVELVGEVAGIDRILEATDAGTAVRLISENKPEVVILDIRVPGDDNYRNGIDVLRWVKQQHPNTAAVILTNYSGSSYRDLCLQAGAYAFLDKSRDFDKLVPVLESLVDVTH